MFSLFHLKATKSRYRGTFSFALRESYLLEKKNCFLDPSLWFDFWLSGQKSNPKVKQTHHKSVVAAVCHWFSDVEKRLTNDIGT